MIVLQCPVTNLQSRCNLPIDRSEHCYLSLAESCFRILLKSENWFCPKYNLLLIGAKHSFLSKYWQSSKGKTFHASRARTELASEGKHIQCPKEHWSQQKTDPASQGGQTIIQRDDRHWSNSWRGEEKAKEGEKKIAPKGRKTKGRKNSASKGKAKVEKKNLLLKNKGLRILYLVPYKTIY